MAGMVADAGAHPLRRGFRPQRRFPGDHCLSGALGSHAKRGEIMSGPISSTGELIRDGRAIHFMK